ncbi:MAG: type II toxin-antitoxin system RelE/ParE family toxin [Deltaproteobacteria bacterium]|nr:type II toxin-antitoxin system RelE/ParE family toxin [Deltaproteobacteria bacterium]
MPRTTVIIFMDTNGTAPLLKWLDVQSSKVQDKCIVKIERLGEMGYELRRPEADLLRDGIYELRVAHRSIQYRILYFFCENMAIISHGLKKESEVPDKDIELALKRLEMFKLNPQRHTYEHEEEIS